MINPTTKPKGRKITRKARRREARRLFRRRFKAFFNQPESDEMDYVENGLDWTLEPEESRVEE